MSHLSDAPAATQRSSDAAVRAVNLVKRYGSTEALRSVDFTMPRGCVFGVIGPNGAGKTTTMRTLLDIVRPTSGHVELLGIDPRHGGPALRRRLGYLPGELILDARSTGRRLLEHYAAISGPMPRGRIEELAERLNLNLSVQVRKLSKGNKQKLGLIQAFMHQPELLVLDEPTSGLDPLVQQEFLAMVKEAKEAGQSVFLSSHVISEVQQGADQVAILRDGRIIKVAAVDALRDQALRHVRLVAQNLTEAQLHSRLAAVEGLAELKIEPTDAGVAAQGVFSGDLPDLLLALNSLTLTDLVLEEPDLEECVLRLYKTHEGAANRNGSSAAPATDEPAENQKKASVK